MTSIRRRTLTLIIGLMLTGLAVISVLNLHDSNHEIAEVYDAQLAQNARMLQGVMRMPLASKQHAELYQAFNQALSEAEVAVANANQKLSALGLSTSSVSGLNRIELRAPFNGIVIEKHLSLGEAVKEDAAVFTISDLTQVWAEINVPAKDLPSVRVGEKVTIKATAFEASATGTVAFVGALIGEETRTAKARVVLENPKGAWRPGLFVNVEVVSEETAAPVTISADAVQNVGEKPVVFLKVNGGFIAQPVKLGRSDGKRIEVLQGLKSGMSYASSGSFVVKSELGKGSAEHTH